MHTFFPHLVLQLFELSIHSFAELSNLPLQSDHLLLSEAHVSAQLGNAGITPAIIGGEEQRAGERPLNEKNGIEGSLGKV